MRRAVLFLCVIVLLVGPAASAQAWWPGEGHRVIMTEAAARKAGLTVRSRLSGGQVTVQLTDAQMGLLSRRGISLEPVPERHVGPPPAADKTLLASGPVGLKAAKRIIPSSQVPWGIKMIYGDPVLKPAGISGGSGVKVAVLDTGSSDHPDFIRSDGSRVIVGCVDFSNPTKEIVPGSCKDGHGHGSHVTGTIAAAGGSDGRGVYGVAPGASIVSYKVLTDAGSGYADDIARAIRYAADHGANIISMSLGADEGTPVELEAIRYAVSKGVLIVAAAGNSGPFSNTIGYPAAWPEVVAVASLSSDESVSSFSSRGVTDKNDATITAREVEVSGPGRNVISTFTAGRYATMSGTSMSTPHVAGLAARMWQGSAPATRAWLRADARAHDISRSEGLIRNAGPGYDIASGYGLPQVRPGSQRGWRN